METADGGVVEGQCAGVAGFGAEDGVFAGGAGREGEGWRVRWEGRGAGVAEGFVQAGGGGEDGGFEEDTCVRGDGAGGEDAELFYCWGGGCGGFF